MCGITALVSSKEDIFPDLYESLYHLQHRGQDSFGFSYFDENQQLLLIKQQDLLSNSSYDNIQTNIGLGHVRYPTKGKNTIHECQPLFLKGKYHTISFVHNGQVEIEPIKSYLLKVGVSVNSSITSDSSFLLYIFDYLLNQHERLTYEIILEIIGWIQENIQGSFNCICLIENYGLICFKDKYSIRPLILGKKGKNYIISSESISITSIDYDIINDIYGHDILIFTDELAIYQSQISTYFKPCIFEWVYLAREESIIYGVNVYQSRVKMGEYLAEKIRKTIDIDGIDCVIPVPDTSKPVALEISKQLKKPYFEAITKNRYVNRTFIMDSQKKRKKNIKRKLNVIQHLIQNKNILIVDDSIVRGNTIKYIVNLLKEYRVKKIFIAISSPEIINTNTFGIDIPTKEELLCFQKTNLEIEKDLGVEKIIFQDITNLEQSIQSFNPRIKGFEKSVFTQ
tara:strand:+ start:1361 stop:2722 length:1362 start_codon:yes stop_codon:yes gene_type:complete